MAISALVITLDRDSERRACALRELGAVQQLTLGAAVADTLPAVLETAASEDDVAIMKQMATQTGVRSVALACALYDEQGSL